jgi:Ser-tRNA(Ala) deacylase AlaX
MAARTKLVYQQHGELRQYLSKILSVNPVSTLPEADQALIKNASEEDYALITDETIFYVQGGGQPSDIGTIEPVPSESDPVTIFEVTAVRQPAAGGAILHFGRFKPTTAPSAELSVFQVGKGIQQNIDGEKRDLFSRLHTAGHILGLAINELSREGVLPPLIESKASHYPDSAAVEFGGIIEGRHKDAIQAKTDEFVMRASKVLIHWWPMEKLLTDCTGVTEGFELPEGETLGRVVEMEGLGAYPCGGTHVGDCGMVGKIEVKKIGRSKGVSRVSYRVS